MKRLGETNLTVRLSKCKFSQDHLHCWGHKVGLGKRSASDLKSQAIKDFPTPITKTKLRVYMGTVGYCSRFVKNHTMIAYPLTNVFKGKM